MKDVLLLARTHVATAIRERITLFWFLVFPVFMLVLLSLIFGQIGEEGEINFDIALINEDAGASDPGAQSDPGGVLALVRQIYQTGADEWELFVTWTLLMLPFVMLARSTDGVHHRPTH